MRKEKDSKAKQLRKAIFDGINGYSQEEASKQASGSDSSDSSINKLVDQKKHIKDFIQRINEAKTFSEPKSKSSNSTL